MPERGPFFRRAAYVAAVTMSSAAFVFSLTGIATTQGHVKPNGDAAAAAKRLQERVNDHAGRCHRAPAAPASASQREV